MKKGNGVAAARYFLSAVLICFLSAGMVRAEDSVRLGAVFAKTGDDSIYNLMHLEGVRFAVNKINLSGGLLGLTIELMEYDNKSQALDAKFQAKKAVEDGVIAVIGASGSAHSLAMAPVLQEAGIPMISPISTHPDLTRIGDYIFRACFSDSFLGEAMAKFARQTLNAKTAVILVQVTRKYSMSLADRFIQTFPVHGGTILWEGEFDDAMTDYMPLLQKAAALKPDVIVFPSGKVGFILTQASGMGLNIPFLGGDGWSDRSYQYGGPVIAGHYYLTHWHRENKNARSAEFVREYESLHGKIVVSGVPLAYDAVNLVANAVKTANSFEPAKIRDALAATRNFEGVTGDISFDPNGDPIKPAVVLQYGDNASVFVQEIQP